MTSEQTRQFEIFVFIILAAVTLVLGWYLTELIFGSGVVGSMVFFLLLWFVPANVTIPVADWLRGRFSGNGNG